MHHQFECTWSNVILFLKGRESDCGHEVEIQKLKEHISELEADNAALVVENSDLKIKASGLLQELSVKEAEWCETEEKLNLKVCIWCSVTRI